jgi:hypothetical protein
MRTMRARTFLVAATALVAVAAPAMADPPLKCGTGQTLVSIDERECPSRPPLPATLVRRVCCKNNAGHVHCMPLPDCPPVSPS